MELIRWIRQEVQKIKNIYILDRIKVWLVCEKPVKKSKRHKEYLEKNNHYREPDLKKWRNNHRK